MPRPKLQPTPQDRHRVKGLAAVGTSHEDIARMIGIRSPKTLRKYFGEELARATADANASVAGALYKKAIDGDVAAQKFWLACRAGWRAAAEPAPTTPLPFVVKIETSGSNNGGSNAQA